MVCCQLISHAVPLSISRQALTVLKVHCRMILSQDIVEVSHSRHDRSLPTHSPVPTLQDSVPARTDNYCCCYAWVSLLQSLPPMPPLLLPLLHDLHTLPAMTPSCLLLLLEQQMLLLLLCWLGVAAWKVLLLQLQRPLRQLLLLHLWTACACG